MRYYLKLASVVLLVFSIVCFGLTVWRVKNVRAAFGCPLKFGAQTDTGVIKVNPKSYCIVMLRFNLKPLSSREIRENYIQTGPDISVRYEVFDANGVRIFQENENEQWTKQPVRPDSSQGEYDLSKARVAEYFYSKFPAPQQGLLRIKILDVKNLDEEWAFEPFRKKITSAEITVYDNVYRHRATVWAGFISLIGSFLLFLTVAMTHQTAIATIEPPPTPYSSATPTEFFQVVYTGCIIRRFCACWFDLLSLLAPLFYLQARYGQEVLQGHAFAIFMQLVLLLYVPELLWGQTLGEFIFGIRVLNVSGRPFWLCLIIRRLANIIECNIPLLYFYVVALSQENKSLSDRASGCIIVRKKYLLKSPPLDKLRMFPKSMAFVIATLFVLLPIILFVVTLLFTRRVAATEGGWLFFHNIANYFLFSNSHVLYYN